MTEQPSPQTRLDTIDALILTPIVQQALESNTPEIIDWERQSLSARSATTSQIYRFIGHAQDGDKTSTWSVILKIGVEEMHGGDAQGGLRERVVYESGFLNNLPSSLVAPRCYGVVEHPDGAFWLWLEDIQETVKKWSLEDFGFVARQLGQFNGRYLTGTPLPTQPWISKGWLRSYVARNESAIPLLQTATDHPFVKRVYPSDLVDALVRLWNEKETFYAALGNLPQTFCHMDAHRRNLFICKDNKGNQQLVAADWAFCGIGTLGEELAPLVTVSIAFDDGIWDSKRVDAFQQIILNNYLNGLQDVGWTGDREIIEFCYAVTTSYRYGLGVVNSVIPGLVDEASYQKREEVFGRKTEQLVDHWAVVIGHNMLTLADKVQSLLPRYQ
jgi:hypothetical protein